MIKFCSQLMMYVPHGVVVVYTVVTVSVNKNLVNKIVMFILWTENVIEKKEDEN